MVDYDGKVVVGNYRARTPVSWVEENKNWKPQSTPQRTGFPMQLTASIQSSEFSEECVA